MFIKNRIRRWGLVSLTCGLLTAGLWVLIASHPLSRTWKESAAADLEVDDFAREQATRAEGLRFRRLSLQDSNGVIDPNGWRNARQHIAEMKKLQPARLLKRKGQIKEAGVARDSWISLGPGNIGGRIRSISINPNFADDILVGSVSGGIWRTLNGGEAWFPVDDFMANLAVTTLVRHPANPSIIYAGTGEGFGNSDAIQGMGIFLSLDGGVSWSQLTATNNANFNFVNRLAIAPNGNTLLAATNSGAWRSDNGGATWSQRTINGTPEIDFHPTDDQFAVLGEYGAARYSQSNGLAWAAATFNPPISGGRVELAYAPSDPTIVYASVDRNGGDVYRSTDGGQSYTRISTGYNYLSSFGWYGNVIWVNPADANTVIVGGVTQWITTNAGGAAIFEFVGNCIHADHHVIVAHPGFNNSTNRVIFGGNDGGIYRANDLNFLCGQNGWAELNNELSITQFYGAAGNPVTGRIVGGAQDNGTLRYTGLTEFWTTTVGNDGGFVAADQTNPNFFYGESQNLQVFRSDDGGDSGTQITNGLGDYLGISCAPNCRTNFIAPLTLDPSEPNRLLAGGWSLWRTNDARGAATWGSIKAPTGGNSAISAIAVASNTSSLILVGHNNGDIYRTLNGTDTAPTWFKIDTANLPNNRVVTRLVIDSTRPTPWYYATFGGFSVDNVYRSTDGGATWIDITGTGATGLPNVPVRTLAIHPVNHDLLYVGTEVGIFTSDDAGATWDISQDGPANVSVDELFWMGGDLIAATHGRGLYQASGGLYVDCNYIGVETGSLTQPFRTVTAAYNALVTYQPIWIRPCVYQEALPPLTKRLEMRTLGTGTVTIKRP